MLFGPGSIQVALKRVHLRGPVSAERRHPRVHFLQRVREDAIDASLRINGCLYEAGFSQNSQMFGDRRLRELERNLEIPDGAPTTGEKGQDGTATWLGEDSECGFHGR